MAVASVDLEEKISHSCIDDFDTQSILEVYGESADLCDDSIDFVGLDDFTSFAGQEISDIKGKIYPSKECSFFMTFSKEYAYFNCDENSQWVKGIQHWIPTVSKSFIQNANINGKESAVRNTACVAFVRWCDMFLHDKKMFGYDLVNLAIGMFHNINVRDAMLISILDENQEWYDDNALAEFAWYPHTPMVSDRLRQFLEAKFIQTSKIPNIKRAITACRVLQVMAFATQSIPELTVQIYALLAYISWWFRLGNVKKYTERALSIDNDCTMAKIVEGAYENKLEPAWISECATPQEK
ncbi:hypothetical protein ACLD5W_00605 [Gardnerella greenwoodii]|uniref:Uncharacterized protein n=2 Tax=Gardnerella greenwoodii TaxID=2914925 RepID=I4M7M9_9BIFI|nr:MULTISPECIES: hypothetical protein [Gardnerella]EIK85219.1 hypothetical protein CGSMWGv00703Dmash_04109 [Gardnerella greenwoodii 00703Dmash]MDF0753224.1 hypothetical protein [Gardnerella greenwoodii]PMC42966.1 hypothetical protein CJ216_02370 [Gardnerella greenwoodii]